jgi:hypothetical protein
MPLVPLNISADIIKAVDEVGLVTHGAEMIDVIIDELNNINRRPGLVELCDLGTSAAVDGLFWWEAQGVVLAVSDGNAYKITAIGGTFEAVTMTGTDFELGKKVTWADFKTAIYAANGGNIKQIDSTSELINIADADAPTAVSHVAFLDRYLLANETGTYKMWFSDVNAPDDWTGNYVSKEARFDNLQGIFAEDLEAFLFGQKTTEVWYNDGSSPFARLAQGFVNRGTIAPSSVVYCAADSTFYFLDQNRHVVKLQGRTAVPVSLTMTKYIQGFTSVTDAKGDYIEIGGRPYYILSFPTEDKCLVYDLTRGCWYRWGFWNTGTSTHDRFRGNSFCIAPSWNYALVGDRANGKIYRFSTTAYDDDGSDLVSLIRTAHYNHGSEAIRKYCNGIYVRLKRTNVVSTDATPDIVVRYRDNGATAWKSDRTITLQQVGDTEFRGKLTRLGSYYSRQWEFSLSDAYPLCLVSVEEDVDIES